MVSPGVCRGRHPVFVVGDRMPSVAKLSATQQSTLFDRWVTGVPVARLSRDFGVSPCRVRTAVVKEADVRKEANTEERVHEFIMDCVRIRHIPCPQVQEHSPQWDEIYKGFHKWSKEEHPRWKVPPDGEFLYYLLNMLMDLTPFASRHYLGRP